MKLSLESTKPIYLQIAEGIEDDILNGILKEDDQAYSQYQIANSYNVNPATAAKGISLLVQEDILYKKRGLGMFVSKGAEQQIKGKRKKIFLTERFDEFMHEADKLGIGKSELKEIIDSYKDVL